MNLHQLEFFVTIAECKNITQAAKRLFVSQPSMSRQISLLEEELRTKLFLRTNHGVELTNAGSILYARSKSLLTNMQDIAEEVREVEEGIRGRINIGTIYTAFPAFSAGINRFRQEYPNVAFYIEPDLPSELLISLEKGTIDVAFLRAPMSNTGKFPYLLLKEERMVLAVHQNMDPCPCQTSIEIDDLRGLPFCSRLDTNNPEYQNWDFSVVLNQECLSRGFTLNTAYECNGALSGFMMTCAGLAACYIPEGIPKLFQCDHVHLKRISGIDSVTAPLLLWNNTRHMSRCLQLFLEHFKTSLSRTNKCDG